MKRGKKKLLIPAALLAGACTPGPGQKCGTESYQICFPDGGFACPPSCGGERLPDGGPYFDDAGQPQCFC